MSWSLPHTTTWPYDSDLFLCIRRLARLIGADSQIIHVMRSDYANGLELYQRCLRIKQDIGADKVCIRTLEFGKDQHARQVSKL